MPKRSNAFQRLITLIEQELAPQGARVTESKLLRDQMTGEDREVDILIETEFGGHPLAIGVECIDQRRRATVEWIDKILGKYHNLPVHKKIAVSRSGFTKTALQKAAAANIETLTLKEATKADWTVIVNRLMSIDVVSFLLPVLAGAKVIFGAPPSTPVTESDLPHAILYTPIGTPHGKLREIADYILTHSKVVEALKEHAYTDVSTMFTLLIPFEGGAYLVDAKGSKHLVHSLEIQAKTQKQVSTIQLDHASYGSAQVAHGTGDTFGHEIAFVFVEQPGRQPAVRVSIRKGAEKKSR